MKRAQLPEKTVEEILDNYVNKGYGLIKSGREFGVGERVVRRILLENGIHIRSFGEAATVSNISRRIHEVNDNYFSQENSKGFAGVNAIVFISKTVFEGGKFT